jgi:hypothetical protein
MRLVFKLAAVVLLGVLAQWALVRFVGTLDEGFFIVRVMVAHAGGCQLDDEMIVDEALRLFERQCRRDGYIPPSLMREHPPEHVRVASAADL